MNSEKLNSILDSYNPSANTKENYDKLKQEVLAFFQTEKIVEVPAFKPTEVKKSITEDKKTTGAVNQKTQQRTDRR